jgi:hypothetical protein
MSRPNLIMNKVWCQDRSFLKGKLVPFTKQSKFLILVCYFPPTIVNSHMSNFWSSKKWSSHSRSESHSKVVDNSKALMFKDFRKHVWWWLHTSYPFDFHQIIPLTIRILQGPSYYTHISNKRRVSIQFFPNLIENNLLLGPLWISDCFLNN